MPLDPGFEGRVQKSVATRPRHGGPEAADTVICWRSAETFIFSFTATTTSMLKTLLDPLSRLWDTYKTTRLSSDTLPLSFGQLRHAQICYQSWPIPCPLTLNHGHRAPVRTKLWPKVLFGRHII